MSEKNSAFMMHWGIVLLVNQIVLFHGCFKIVCLLAALPHTGIIAYLYTAFVWEPEEETLEKPKPSYEKQTETDPLKQKGDAYEKFIGKKFEAKGELVVYNGLIRGMDDRGVDIISLSSKQKIINLIQCKNWTYKEMNFSDIEEIYRKLNQYALDIDELDTQSINHYLHNKKSEDEIDNEIKSAMRYTTLRKTLYIASEKVINPEIGKHLTMIQTNIFRYKDMKIVFVPLEDKGTQPPYTESA